MSSLTNSLSISPELSKRILTGLAGIVVFTLLIVYAGRVGVAAISVIMSLGMLFEFVDMVFTLHDKREKRLILLGSAWLIAFINFWIPRMEFELLLFAFFPLFAYFLFTVERHHGDALATHFWELMASLFGILYLVFLPLFLISLRDVPKGMHWTLIFFIVVWASDSAAYFVGRKYGKRKLFAAISPNKTVEGAAGGLAAGFILVLLYKAAIFRQIPWSATIAIPIFVGIFAQLGDLCESFLKRAFHRKDSGSMIPGHGGFLDRFDGVVFALPVMYGCVKYLGGVI